MITKPVSLHSTSVKLYLLTPAGVIGEPIPSTPEGFKKAKNSADALIEQGMPWVQVERRGGMAVTTIVYAQDLSACPAPCGR